MDISLAQSTSQGLWDEHSMQEHTWKGASSHAGRDMRLSADRMASTAAMRSTPADAPDAASDIRPRSACHDAALPCVPAQAPRSVLSSSQASKPWEGYPQSQAWGKAGIRECTAQIRHYSRCSCCLRPRRLPNTLHHQPVSFSVHM